MTNAQKYIDLVSDMYNLSQSFRDKLSNNVALIEQQLKFYLWDDVKLAIQKFFAYKNDKSYPRLSQIIAILDANNKRLQQDDDVQEITKPSTNIRIIQDCFLEVVGRLHIDGCYYSEYHDKILHVPFGNKHFFNTITNQFGNKLWAWQNAISTLKRRFPKVYNTFTDVTQTELYALAWKYNCVDLT